MNGYSRKDKKCPQLLDLIKKQEEWHVKGEGRSHGLSDEKKLELRLGPPGEDWTINDGHKSRERHKSLLSLGDYSDKSTMIHNTINTCGVKRGAMDTVELSSGENGWINNCGNHSRKFSSSENPGVVALARTWPSTATGYQAQSQSQSQQQQSTNASILHLQSCSQNLSAMEKESVVQSSCTKLADLQNAENKAFSPVSANTAVLPNSSQKRSAPTRVVGWPPIRSFRKNLASSSSSKSPSETQKVVDSNIVCKKPIESCQKDKLVKINMDGVIIGRKVDLQVYDSYEKLSSAVDELFRGLLAAQCDPSANGIDNKQEGEKAITGILYRSGEYTLVYEDNEGDRMLVGDVPWHMFVSTVKRLRVLKTSDLPKLWLDIKQEKAC